LPGREPLEQIEGRLAHVSHDERVGDAQDRQAGDATERNQQGHEYRNQIPAPA
jgi:hypothetical protein